MDKEDGPGIIGHIFQEELLRLDGMHKKRIQVWINSMGGDVEDGFLIYDSILRTATPVDTYCVGIAASIAGVIFQAGRRRIMNDYAILMYHNPFIAKDNVSDTGRKMLESMRNSIITMVSKRSGMNEREVGYMMDRTTFIESAEAKEKGLCDCIESSADSNLKYIRKDKAENNLLTYYKGYQQVLNKLYITNSGKQENKPAMLKLTTYLGLNNEANEDAVLDSVKDVKNKLYKAEVDITALNKQLEDAKNSHTAAMDKIKSDMDELENKLKAKQKEYEDCKAKLDGMEKEKETAENNAKKIKAETMVKEFATAGRIKNEEAVINKWVGLAIVDFDNTKAMIEDLPLNKPAVKIEQVANKLKEGDLPTTAMALQAQVINRLKHKS